MATSPIRTIGIVRVAAITNAEAVVQYQRGRTIRNTFASLNVRGLGGTTAHTAATQIAIHHQVVNTLAGGAHRGVTANRTPRRTRYASI